MEKKSTGVSPQSFSSFGRLLRYLRERAHLSQRDLAAAAGYHHSYISYMERDVRIPGAEIIKARFVPALQIELQDKWINRLLQLANEAETTPPDSSLVNVDASPIKWNGAVLSPLFGRVAETKNICAFLLDDSTRLVTLVGPPGVGKTRLAIHAAEEVQSYFSNGIFFVNLAPVENAEDVLTVFSEALGLQETQSLTKQAALQSFLKNSNTLIVLDNFEQVLPASKYLIPLLAGAPKVKFLVTSREALRLNGEQEFLLAPLPVPDKKDKTKVLDFPSVELFLQRASAANPEFQPTDENASFAAEICRRLDGLPLAIELAAARTRSLSPRLMLEQFDRRFDWLASAARDLPPWRQTLRGAIEWSYALLDEHERALFCRLSVFSGSWLLSAAEEVCSDNVLCPASEIMRLSLQLVEKSLLMVDPHTGRYRFLETLREYAKENLEKSTGFESYYGRHAKYYANLAKENMPQLVKPEMLDRIEAEHTNIRAALSYYTRSNLFLDAAEAVLAVSNFWNKRSYFTEARRWLEAVAAMNKEPTILRANLLVTLSWHYRVQGEYQLAESVAEESRIIFENFHDEAGINSVLDILAILAGIKGDYPRTIELLEKVAGYRRSAGDTIRLFPTLNNMAIANRRIGNLLRAAELYEEVILVAEKTGNLMSLGHALFGLSEVQVNVGNYQSALELSQRSLLVRYQLGDAKGVAYSLTAITIAKSFLGEFEIAAQLESAGHSLREELKVVITPIAQTETDAFHSKLRTRLGEEAFDQAWAKGMGLSMEQAFAFATTAN